MTEFNYNPTITGRVIKTKEEQFDTFFYQGHPLFLIPDFNQNPEDIWLSYMEFLEKNHSCEIYDQDGGEVHSIEIIDENTGLTKCIYTAYGITLDENDESQDVDLEIEGYVVDIPEGNINEYVFVATKVFENYKMSI
jgi:hypothetical protein